LSRVSISDTLIIESSEPFRREPDAKLADCLTQPDPFCRYEDVISGLISVKLANPGLKIVDNTSMLSFNALIFSMRALIAEANELEVTVRELLQVG
jgi:hypothetical protein